jgi:hypothetical protein
VDFPTEAGEVKTNFRADEAGGSGDEQRAHKLRNDSFQCSVFSIKKER